MSVPLVAPHRPLDEGLPEYEQERQDMVRARMSALIPVAVAVMLLDASFNVLARPDLFLQPMVPRAVLLGFLGALYGAIRWLGPQRMPPVAAALAASTALLLYVGWLVRITDGANSPLQPGILLVMLGTQLLVPLRTVEALGLALAALLGWAEGLIGMGGEPWRVGAGLFYLTSGIAVSVLTAQVNTRLRWDAWRARRAMQDEYARSERVLFSALPSAVVERLKRGERVADTWPEACVLFADLVGFTALSSNRDPVDVLDLLSRTFGRFDAIVARHGVEKIKTIGDAYMVAAGLGEGRTVEDLARLALDLQASMRDDPGGTGLSLRIGLHAGPVVAGVLGNERFLYDLWGDTVNVAARMESLGLPGRVHLSDAAHARLGPRFACEARGVIDVKGKGAMTTWWLLREDPA